MLVPVTPQSSLYLVVGEDAAVTHWTCERIPHLALRIPYSPPGMVLGPTSAIGVTDGQHMLAGIVFHGYDPYVQSIEVSCAAEDRRWANREVFRAVLRYPFAQLDCQRVTAATPRRATSTRRFLEGLGFRREGSIRRGFGDDNAIVYGLLREEWLEGRFCCPRGALTDGEEKRPTAPSGA